MQTTSTHAHQFVATQLESEEFPAAVFNSFLLTPGAWNRVLPLQTLATRLLL